MPTVVFAEVKKADRKSKMLTISQVYPPDENLTKLSSTVVELQPEVDEVQTRALSRPVK
jgi:hypothetical protein